MLLTYQAATLWQILRSRAWTLLAAAFALFTFLSATALFCPR